MEGYCGPRSHPTIGQCINGGPTRLEVRQPVQDPAAINAGFDLGRYSFQLFA